MADTHSFKLPSGFTCEVREMLGKHQRLLTGKGGNYADKLNTILKDIIVSVNGQPVDEEFVNQMLAVDRKAALVQSRHFSVGFPETFTFEYTYQGEFIDKLPDGTKVTKNECKETLEIPTPDFPIKPYAGSEEWANAPYSGIERYRYLELPRSKQKVRWKLLDGVAEGVAMATKDKERSTHTPLEMRNVCYAHKGPNEEVYVKLDLDKLALLDIEAIRKDIATQEGDIDTIVILEHPHADQVDEQFKHPRVDLLQEVAFFFPSQAI